MIILVCFFVLNSCLTAVCVCFFLLPGYYRFCVISLCMSWSISCPLELWISPFCPAPIKKGNCLDIWHSQIKHKMHTHTDPGITGNSAPPPLLPKSRYSVHLKYSNGRKLFFTSFYGNTERCWDKEHSVCVQGKSSEPIDTRVSPEGYLKKLVPGTIIIFPPTWTSSFSIPILSRTSMLIWTMSDWWFSHALET